MKRRFTLVELVAYMAVIFLVVSVVTQFFYQASLLQRGFAREALMNQKLHLVQRHWQRVIAATSPQDWVCDPEEALWDGRCGAGFRDEELHFLGPERRVKVQLPSGATVGFAVEWPSGRAPVAVMTVEWDRRLHRKVVRERARLVACAGKGKVDA